MFACAVDAIAELFNLITMLFEATYGLYAGYGGVCSIDFSSGYAEGTIVGIGTDAANSFYRRNINYRS